MGEILGAIQSALGYALSFLYSLTHSNAVAIILLTLIVRALLLPLSFKSTKSMAAMQALAPEQKKIQQKYRELQKKAKDRMEVQQLRMQMQQEVQALYKANGVSPLGGCLPQLGQFPVLIAMFSVMRAAIPVTTMAAALVTGTAGPGTAVTRTTFSQKNLRGVVCRPVTAESSSQTALTIECPTADPTAGVPNPPTATIKLSFDKLQDAKGATIQREWLTACLPFEDKATGKLGFACRTGLGTGHIPRDSRLFSDLTQDHATVFGMHTGCTASQVSSPAKAKQCTTDPHAGGAAKAIPYYLLVALIVGTTYYSTKQISRRSQGGQVGQQQQMMAKIMPVFMGFISLNLPAGSNLYFFVTNLWQMGQQHLQFQSQDAKAGTAPPPPKEGSKTGGFLRGLLPSSPAGAVDDPKPEPPNPQQNKKPQQGSKKKRKKKKR